ncbi:MAG: glutathione S-transferase family protein [Hyphomicrobiaceae bacterium]|nr:glutathione S-transferase family protein [Hyphomicrobiaceae bacterium]
MLQLIHYPLCPHSRSIRLAIDELRLPVGFREELPWVWRPEFLSINPAGNLPVLLLDNGAPLCGAYAIAEYLGDIYPMHPADGKSVPLFPGTAEDRAEVRRLVDWFHHKCDSEVTRELVFEKYTSDLQAGRRHTPNSANLRAIASNLRYHMTYIGYLADHRRWLAGDEMSFADLAAAAHLSCMDYLGQIPWDDFPAARGWYVRLKSRPSFQALLEDRLPGKPPPHYYSDLDF